MPTLGAWELLASPREDLREAKPPAPSEFAVHPDKVRGCWTR